MLQRIASLFFFTFALCGAASAQSSDVSIEQVGPKNEAGVTTGTSSLIALHQMGLANLAIIEQVGSDHRVRLRQEGDATASIMQEGSGHQLVGLDGEGSSALQEDGSELVLIQQGTDTLAGFANTVFLHQSDGAYADITQSGATNTVIARQTLN